MPKYPYGQEGPVDDSLEFSEFSAFHKSKHTSTFIIYIYIHIWILIQVHHSSVSSSDGNENVDKTTQQSPAAVPALIPVSRITPDPDVLAQPHQSRPESVRFRHGHSIVYINKWRDHLHLSVLICLDTSCLWGSPSYHNCRERKYINDFNPRACRTPQTLNRFLFNDAVLRITIMG